MPVTMTIKQVPDPVADRLRRRAAENRRSLQRELLLIVERAADEGAADGVREPGHPVYRVACQEAGRVSHKSRHSESGGEAALGKLSLDALWRRAHRLGAQMPAESAAIVRRDRDARHGH